MKEVWKVIEDFKAYAVSNLGRVKRLKQSSGTSAGRILQARPSKRGYLKVSLMEKGKRYVRFVHILVANTFIPNPNRLKEVNHKGTKRDNRVCKLERMSIKDHALDVARRGQRGDGVFFDKVRGKYRATIPDFSRPQYKVYLGSFLTYEEALAVRKEALQ